MTGRQTKWWGVPDLLGGALLLVMSVLVVLSVLSRKVPGISPPSADQMLPDMLVWVAMLGTAAALRRNEHLGISLLTDKLPRKAQRVTGAFVLVATAAFFIPLLVRGAITVQTDAGTGLQGPAGYPYWVVSLALPVGAAFCLLYLVVHAYRLVRGIENRPSSAEAVL